MTKQPCISSPCQGRVHTLQQLAARLAQAIQQQLSSLLQTAAAEEARLTPSELVLAVLQRSCCIALQGQVTDVKPLPRGEQHSVAVSAVCMPSG